MKRLAVRMAICIFSLALLLLSTFAVGSSTAPINPKPPIDLHLTLGNPSDATTQVTNKNNFLMIKPQFALSYNNRKGGPNWVSWHLKDDDDQRRIQQYPTPRSDPPKHVFCFSGQGARCLSISRLSATALQNRSLN